jgi:hypothetical protein
MAIKQEMDFPISASLTRDPGLKSFSTADAQTLGDPGFPCRDDENAIVARLE